jgi:hypothetical protein
MIWKYLNALPRIGYANRFVAFSDGQPQLTYAVGASGMQATPTIEERMVQRYAGLLTRDTERGLLAGQPEQFSGYYNDVAAASVLGMLAGERELHVISPNSIELRNVNMHQPD